ncbi:MAG: ribosome silencing factor, partial [Phycisphaerae bacterium]
SRFSMGQACAVPGTMSPKDPKSSASESKGTRRKASRPDDSKADEQAPAASAPVSPRDAVAARRLAIESARTAEDDKCDDVIVLDLRGRSPICDYFVIATGTSDRQLKAVSEHIEEMARGRGEKPFGVSGLRDGAWIVLDYVNVVIHLFEPDLRRYYDLEMLWGDGPRVRWQRRARRSESAA